MDYLTHTGKVRQHNEDSAAAFPNLGLAVVADGMGGHEAGEIASQLAVEQIRQQVAAGQSLSQAIQVAHQAILAAPADGIGLAGMGTTVVAAKCQLPQVEIAWVGDSRAYLWSQGKLTQLTRDHSYVQGLIDAGALTPEQALQHPERNIITQSLGSTTHGQLAVDTITTCCANGDLLLLCSDGLTGEISDASIADILAQQAPLTSLASQLIDAANQAGGSDNITVLLIAGKGRRPNAQTRKLPAVPSQSKPVKPYFKPIAVVLVLLFIALLSLWLWQGKTEPPIPTVSGSALFPAATAPMPQAKDTEALPSQSNSDKEPPAALDEEQNLGDAKGPEPEQPAISQPPTQQDLGDAKPKQKRKGTPSSADGQQEPPHYPENTP